jgi:glutamyl-tRNA reductase
VQQLKIIAFTHKRTPLNEMSRFFLHDESREERLSALKYALGLSELYYLATCNRVEFLFVTQHALTPGFTGRFFRAFREDWSETDVQFAQAHGETYEGEDALEHIYRVAASLDSLVIGEREIITQVRKAYDECHRFGLTGDMLRLVVKSTITTAKQVYTDTLIATNPVSVVSLAYRRLRDLSIAPGARILMIGAGETNTSFSRYLVKYGFSRITVFNRTPERANELVAQLATHAGIFRAYPLEALAQYSEGFDVLISCTGSAMPVVTPELYRSLVHGETTRKVVVDLAIPSDVDPRVTVEHPVELINIDELKPVAEKNLAERRQELVHAERIIREQVLSFRDLLRTRQVELAMKDVPGKIRQIRETAVSTVFAREIETLDAPSRDVLDKVLSYMEKKYITLPMVMAKEIILESR